MQIYVSRRSFPFKATHKFTFWEDRFPLKRHTNLHFENNNKIYILSRPVLCKPTHKPIHLPSQGTTQHRCPCCRAQCGPFSWAQRSSSWHGTCRCCHGWTWSCCCSSGGFCVSCPFCQTRWWRRWRWSLLLLHPQSLSQFRTLKNRIVKRLHILKETLISLKQNKSRRRREIKRPYPFRGEGKLLLHVVKLTHLHQDKYRCFLNYVSEQK